MSNNLDRTLLASNHVTPEIVVNNSDGVLDAALTEVVDVEVDDTNATTLLGSTLRSNSIFRVTPGSPTPTAGITITVPAIKRGFIGVINTTAQTVSVTITSQPISAPTVAAGASAVFFIDSVNVRGLASAGGATNLLGLTDTPSSYASGDAGKVLAVNSGETAMEFIAKDFIPSVFLPGTLGSSATLLTLVIDRDVEFPDDLASSQGYAGTTDSSGLNIDVQKNGASIGTISFAASTATATFTTAGSGAETFAAGDRLSLVAPASPGAWADVSITLQGTQG